MKTKSFLVAIFCVVSFVLTSCQQDDGLEPGIVYTNDPPEELFDGIYASTNKAWLEKADFNSAKNLGWNSNLSWNEDAQNYVNYDSGEWFLLPARKFWGIMNGIIYLSESKDWYVVSPDGFAIGGTKVKEKETIIGYICNGCQNPFGEVMIGNYFE